MSTLTEIMPGTHAALAGLSSAVHQRLERLASERFVPRLWDNDTTLFTVDPTDRASVANRLGWLSAPESVSAQREGILAIVEWAKATGLKRAVLLGMGGSSLRAEVLRATFARGAGIELVVLDSTVPAMVSEASRDAASTVYIVASKSGSTLEVDAFHRYFRALAPASRFLAVTDPGTALDARARADGFAAVLNNPADIGGRFSALSNFGLLPAAVLGVDLDDYVSRAVGMKDRCRASDSESGNPGLFLGVFLGEAARAGRDKLTLLLDSPFGALGVWIEQLVAESTGKLGLGVVPIDGERFLVPFEDDRVFVHVGAEPSAQARSLAAEGHPVVSLAVPSALELGAEFFRWCFATAVAGAVLEVNPFDEPNVGEAKARTAERLAVFEATGRLPLEVARAADDGIIAYADAGLEGEFEHPIDVIEQHLARARPGDYVSLLAYVPSDGALPGWLDETRALLARTTGRPTTLGYGPRYLHSTGQLHKGGGDGGLFVMLTADDQIDLRIPGQTYTFGTLAAAQATGDYAALCAHGRRVLRLHFTSGLPGGFHTLFRFLGSCSESLGR